MSIVFRFKKTLKRRLAKRVSRPKSLSYAYPKQKFKRFIHYRHTGFYKYRILRRRYFRFIIRRDRKKIKKFSMAFRKKRKIRLIIKKKRFYRSWANRNGSDTFFEKHNKKIYKFPKFQIFKPFSKRFGKKRFLKLKLSAFIKNYDQIFSQLSIKNRQKTETIALKFPFNEAAKFILIKVFRRQKIKFKKFRHKFKLFRRYFHRPKNRWRRKFRRFRVRHYKTPGRWKYNRILKRRRYIRRYKRKIWYAKKFKRRRFLKRIRDAHSLKFPLPVRLARITRPGFFYSGNFARSFRNRITVRVKKTYNNFFISVQMSESGQNVFTYSTGRVDLRRNRRLTKQALEIASRTLSFAIRNKNRIHHVNFTILGRTTYHSRIFLRALRQARVKISAINFVLKRGHNGLRTRSSRRV